MVFSSIIFLFAFLPCLLGLYYLAADKYKNYILLFFSLVFYAWDEPKFVYIMILIAVLDWAAALLMEAGRAVNEKVGKICSASALVIALCSNLGVLLYYKYTGFLLQNINALFDFSIPISKIIMPIGISFFTFQALSYVIDVYRKEVSAQKNPFLVLLYISLFPQLVAGPIVRYQTVEKEIRLRTVSVSDFAAGWERFIIGLSKKLILANPTGELADLIFDGGYLSAPTAWLGAVSYMLQIYFDFSAYSDMAIGLGRMFGFRFLENFRYPYAAESITDFWRRWHISLSTWFRDYVYIPLGGSRKGSLRTVFNLLVVWLVTGLWHGASWNFVLWGLYYFVLLMLEKFLLPRIFPKIPKLLRRIYVLFAVLFGWILFRTETLSDFSEFVRAMFTFRTDTLGASISITYLVGFGLYLLLGAILCQPILPWISNAFSKRLHTEKQKMLVTVLRYAGLLLLFALCVLYLVSSTYNPFIYFRF